MNLSKCVLGKPSLNYLGFTITGVVAELKVVLKLITLGVKFQECAAHSNKSNNSKLTLERNLLIVLTAKR